MAESVVGGMAGTRSYWNLAGYDKLSGFCSEGSGSPVKQVCV